MTAVEKLMTTIIVVNVILYVIVIWVGIYLTLRKLRDISERRKTLTAVVAAVIFTGWFLSAYALGMRGFFIAHPDRLPIPALLGFLLPIAAIFLVYRFSTIFHQVIHTLPLSWLFIIQVQRVTAIYFFIYYFQGKLPKFFVFIGGSLDILTGLIAPFVTYFYYKKKSGWRNLAIGWNIFGLLDLLISGVVIGFLAMPSSIRIIHLNPSTGFLTEMPLVILMLVIVPLDLSIHIFALIRLSKKQQSSLNQG
ncbi:hypothetical protein HYR99_18605 [Candidatus Poribacteria bacterium]|nr:hypothetical protein [Candidatus Poribacteria bacterium]